MARVSIDLPERFLFTTYITVRVTDLNYGAHVGNDTYLSFMHEARVQFYQSLGFADEISLEGSVGQMMADAAIVYKSEAFLGDRLSISLAAHDFNKYGFDLLYRISHDTTGKEVARAKTGIVGFDFEKRKIAPIPQVLLARLQ